MNNKTWGGKREGAGRPKVTIKRKQRVIHLFDEEWELIKNKALDKNMTIRAYLYWLAEHDKVE